MRTYLFDDKRSVWHAVLGYMTTILPLWFSLPLLGGYVIYEVREPEDPVATVGDVVEFIIGFMIGVILKCF